jgi:hypothetical protein
MTAKIHSWVQAVAPGKQPAPLSDEFTRLNVRSLLLIGGWATVAAAIGDKVVHWLACMTGHQ